MKTLNFDYDVNTSDEVKSELDEIAKMSEGEVCDKYCLDPEDVSKFISMMRDDLETLLFSESMGSYTDDRNEEYAQLYNFL